MINATDLMLGNWVKGPIGSYLQVNNVNAEYVGVSYTIDRIGCSEHIEVEKIWPIPLTQHLMELIGWSLPKYQYFPHGEGAGTVTYVPEPKKRTFVGLTFVLKDWGVRKKGDIVFGNKVIEFLHELQNIYRWETGTPLDITL